MSKLPAHDWIITLTFGRIELSIIETAPSELCAIASATRYAAAMGYSGQPDKTTSRRIH
jgi:hypothetical protein